MLYSYDPHGPQVRDTDKHRESFLVRVSQMTDRSQVQQAIDAGGGVLRLEPCWVPRSFMIPGRRLTGWYSAKELTVLPRRSVTIKDGAAYGIILTQGYGGLGKLSVSTPAMIRFGQMTEDELFVTAEAAKAGVRIENRSDTEPLVMLKHFGPGNPDAESFRKH